MSRIYCKTPSTGTVRNYAVNNIPLNTWVDIAEAPDYSVPDARKQYPQSRDPNDSTRAIRSGEVFFMTPIFARNSNDPNDAANSPAIIETRLILEDGTTVRCPGRMNVPPGDTAMVPVQGRSLVKRNYLGTYGDRLQIKVDTAGIDIWASSEIKPSSENTLEG